MVQIISSLGTASGSGITVENIARPIGSSIGLSMVAVIACRWVIRPIYTRCHTLCDHSRAPLVGYTLVLFAFLAVAGYAGSSVLFAAFLAGVTSTWFDSIRMKKLWSAASCYETYYEQSVRRLLKPFFFVSAFGLRVTGLISCTRRPRSGSPFRSDACSLAQCYGEASSTHS